MKRILIIPHHPHFKKLKIRLAELAKFLTKDYEVYLLDWRSASSRYDWVGRFGSCLKDLWKLPKIYDSQQLKVIEIPMLHRPLLLASFFNSFWLLKILKKFNIDIVVNGSCYLFSLPGSKTFKYVFDFADVPVSGQKASFDKFIEKRVSEEVEKADYITASSRGLVEYIKNLYNKDAFFLPNGADFERFKEVSLSDVEQVRTKYGLDRKWVIGHIGYLGAWVDVAFLVEVYREVKKEIPQAALFLVGGSSQFDGLRKKFHDKDIIFAGNIDSGEIEKYFLACDVGVLPHKKSEFQDLAFHIKLIEFSVARKFVVASHMEEVKRLSLPNVLIASLDKKAWVDALLNLRASLWDPLWDKIVEDYDWRKIAERLKEIVGI